MAGHSTCNNKRSMPHTLNASPLPSDCACARACVPRAGACARAPLDSGTAGSQSHTGRKRHIASPSLLALSAGGVYSRQAFRPDPHLMYLV